MKQWASMAVLLLVFGLGVTTAAQAKERSVEDLTHLSDQALVKANEGDFAGALKIWLDILEEFPVGGKADLHVNIALAYERLGRLPESWYHIDQALEYSRGQDPQLLEERARIEERLSKTYGKVVLNCQPEGSLVLKLRDGPKKVKCPLQWWVVPGTHKFRIDVSGGNPVLKAVEVKSPGQVVTVDISLAGTPVKGPDDGKKGASKTSRLWPWVMMGGGAVLVVTGGVLQYLAYDANEQLKSDYPADPTLDPSVLAQNKQSYDDGFESDVKPKAYGAYALYGLGGAAVVGGAVWMFLQSSKVSKGEKASFYWMPSFSQDGTGFVLGVPF